MSAGPAGAGRAGAGRVGGDASTAAGDDARAGSPGLGAGIWVLAIAVFVVGTDKDLLAGILPAVAEGTGAGPGTVAQLATVFALTYAVAAPVLAVALARVPRRRVMVTALVCFAGANALCALAPSFAVLLLARVVAALGAAAFTPLAAAVAGASARPGHAGRALAVVFAGFSVASVVGVPLGTVLGVHLGWRAPFAAVAVLALGAAALVARAVPVTPPAPVTALSTRLAVLRNPAARRVLLVSATAQAGGFAYLLLIGVHAVEVTGGDGVVPLLIGCFGVCGLAGTWIAGQASDRRDPVRTLRWAAGTAAVVLLLTPVLVTGPVSLVLLVAVWSCAQWALTVPVQATLLRLPGDGPVAVSLNSSAMYAGSAVAGLVGAVALAAGGPAALPLAAGVLVAVAFGISLLVRVPADVSPA